MSAIKGEVEWLLKMFTIAICVIGVVNLTAIFMSNDFLSTEHIFLWVFVFISVVANFPVVIRFCANFQIKRYIVPISKKMKWSQNDSSVLVFKTESFYFASFDKLLHTVYALFAFLTAIEFAVLVVVMKCFGSWTLLTVRLVMLMVPNVLDLIERLKRPTEEVKGALKEIKSAHEDLVKAQKGEFDGVTLKKVVAPVVNLISGK